VLGTPSTAASFDPAKPWRLHPKVALRNEPFGALAYHYETRRLVFLHSQGLVDLVNGLERFDSADAALDEQVAPDRRATYERALARLAASGVIDAR
jgi:mycofactocin biosynthesis protein MftB